MYLKHNLKHFKRQEKNARYEGIRMIVSRSTVYILISMSII